MKIILTGATSFLGKAALNELEKEGHEVTALRHSFEDEPRPLPERADVWLHFAWAGVGSAGRSDKNIQSYNIEMSLRALKKALELKCGKFIFAGSQAEYGIRTGEAAFLPEREDDDCFPVSEYGKAKLEFGRLAEKTLSEGADPGKMKYIHMRIFSVYGPGDHEGSLISTAVKNFLEDRPMEFGACEQDWNYLYADDAAKAVAVLVNAGNAEGVYNIGSGDTRPLKAYIGELYEICKALRKDRALREVKDFRRNRPLNNDKASCEGGSLCEDKASGGDKETRKAELSFGKRKDNAEGAVSLRPDTERIRKDTCWEPVTSFEEGIIRTVEFLKSGSREAALEPFSESQER